MELALAILALLVALVALAGVVLLYRSRPGPPVVEWVATPTLPPAPPVGPAWWSGARWRDFVLEGYRPDPAGEVWETDDYRVSLNQGGVQYVAKTKFAPLRVRFPLPEGDVELVADPQAGFPARAHPA